MKISKADYQQWANDPVTCAIRNYLVGEIRDLDSLTNHPLIDKNTYTDDLTALEQVGTSVLLRSSAIKGLEMFTNFDELVNGLVEAGVIEGAEKDDE